MKWEMGICGNAEMGNGKRGMENIIVAASRDSQAGRGLVRASVLANPSRAQLELMNNQVLPT